MAIDYYYRVIKKVCEVIHANSRIVSGNGADRIESFSKRFKFQGIIPESLHDKGAEDFKILYNKKQQLKNAVTGSLSATKRGYLFVFKIEPPEQNQEGEVEVYLSDVPTTLNTIVETIKR